VAAVAEDKELFERVLPLCSKELLQKALRSSLSYFSEFRLDRERCGEWLISQLWREASDREMELHKAAAGLLCEIRPVGPKPSAARLKANSADWDAYHAARAKAEKAERHAKKLWALLEESWRPTHARVAEQLAEADRRLHAPPVDQDAPPESP
jgi:hypothetical protein